MRRRQQSGRRWAGVACVGWWLVWLVWAGVACVGFRCKVLIDGCWLQEELAEAEAAEGQLLELQRQLEGQQEQLAEANGQLLELRRQLVEQQQLQHKLAMVQAQTAVLKRKLHEADAAAAQINKHYMERTRAAEEDATARIADADDEVVAAVAATHAANERTAAVQQLYEIEVQLRKQAEKDVQEMAGDIAQIMAQMKHIVSPHLAVASTASM